MITQTLPSNALIGLGLRQPHYRYILENETAVGWFEVHSENFFLPSIARDLLLKIREKYPISLHGIGLSLGSSDGLQMEHLRRLKELENMIDPFLLSEHLSWNQIDQTYFPDLFPLPYTDETFQIVCQNVSIAQDFLKRNILIENPSSYIEYRFSTIPEVEFLVNLCKVTGAKILLDLNNIFVSCHNHQWDMKEYILNIPPDLVGEIHLAGHSIQPIDKSSSLLIDTHDTRVCPQVWELYHFAIQRFTHCPTLIEWDTNIPTYSILEEEALKASQYLHANKLTASI